MADPKQKEASQLQTDKKPDFETFVAPRVANKRLSMEDLDAVAEYFDHKREYGKDTEKQLAVLLDGMGKDREVTINFQKAIGMSDKEADGYIASIKKGNSTSFDQFWRYYDEQKRIAAGRPPIDPLENPKDFEELLSIALNDDNLSDPELDAIAGYLGGTEQVWSVTREKVLSLLDDIKTEKSSDRVLGRKFQFAIKHTETDGIIGGKEKSNTIAQFWKYYRERRGSAPVPAAQATPAATVPAIAATAPAATPIDKPVASQTVTESTDVVEGADAVTALVTALRTNSKIDLVTVGRIRAYAFNKNEKPEHMISLVARASSQSNKSRAEVIQAIAQGFEFKTTSTSVDKAFMSAFVGANTVLTNDGKRDTSQRQRNAALQGVDSKELDARFKGHYVNPASVRKLIEQHTEVLRNRPDDKIRIDWEALVAVILSNDIPSLARKKEQIALDFPMLDKVLESVSNSSLKSGEKTNREIRFIQFILSANMGTGDTTVNKGAALAAIGSFKGTNDRVYAAYDGQSAKKKNTPQQSSYSLDSEDARRAFLVKADSKNNSGKKYLGGIVSTLANAHPYVDTDSLENVLGGDEKVLGGKTMGDIARMMVDLATGKGIPGYRAKDGMSTQERRELQTVLSIVYDHVSKGILSASHVDFRQDQPMDELKMRSQLLDIQTIILNTIATDKLITQKPSDDKKKASGDSYIGRITIKTDAINSASIRTQPKRNMGPGYSLEQSGDMPVLPVTIDKGNGETTYVIEWRERSGWVVVPPLSQGASTMGIRIETIDRDSIASALYDAQRLGRGQK